MNRILSYYLGRLIQTGTLVVTDPQGTVQRFGDGGAPLSHIRFNTPRAERALAVNPPLKLAEGYMAGEIDLVEGSIYDLLHVAAINTSRHGAEEPWMRAIETARRGIRRFVQNNDIRRARSNVAHHYDLSSELYDLFLDRDRQYSCAYFETPETGLDEAQLAKKRHVAAKTLFDRPGLKTLDIGCGWGGLGLYLAEIAQADVTGVTLSVEQQKIASERAAASGLSDHARFELRDYRHAEGPFDRIVSVGMFEHVGLDFYDEFFGHTRRLLADDGVMLLHTIGHFERPRNTNSFIAKYIFPGGYLPTLSEIMPAVERHDLMVTDVEVLRLHYAETLRHWRERFEARRDEAKALYDERFCRMWEFYLAGSECAFRYQDLVVFQLQIARRHGVVPITRTYIERAEKALRARECALWHQTPECCAAE